MVRAGAAPFGISRTDRITAMTPTGERYLTRRADLVKAWRRETNAPE